METQEALTSELEQLRAQVSRLQTQLSGQEKLAGIGLLSAGIAHEVQNPLNFVLNFSKMSAGLLDEISEIASRAGDGLSEDDLLDLEELSADLKSNLEKINEHTERAVSVVRGILLQSRGKQGEFLPTDLPALIHEYAWLSYHSFRANDKTFNVAIHEEYPEHLPRYMVIPQDYSRAVLNVVNNAFYAIRERAATEEASYAPRLSVTLTCTDSELTLALTDNGTGMTEETRSRIFENFFTTKPSGQGTGLGMGIVRHLVCDNHGGRMNLESKWGEGTTITLTVPAKPVR